MSGSCVGVAGTFQYMTPRCTKQQQQQLADALTPEGRPAVVLDEDPQARCDEKGGKPDELEDICPQCNDEIVWVRRRIDVSHPELLQSRDPESQDSGVLLIPKSRD